MAPLIANKIQDIQKRHDNLTDLSDDFLQTINVYQQYDLLLSFTP